MDTRLTDSKPFSITPYFDVLYRHRRSATGVFVVGFSLTLCLVVLLRNQYVAIASIVIEPPQVSPNYVSTASDRNDTIKAVDQLEGLAHKAFTDSWLEQLILRRGLYHVAPAQTRHNRWRTYDALVKYMRQQIAMQVPPDTIQWEGAHPGAESPVIFTISFTYSDRIVTQQVTAELASRFIEEGHKERTGRAAEAARFLQGQVAKVRSELEVKAKRKRELEQRFAGSLPEELPANLAQQERLEEQLRMVNEQMAISPLAPLGSATSVTPEQQLASLKLKLTHLKTEFSDEYPDVIDLKNEIAHLKTEIAAEPRDGGEKHGTQDFGGGPYRRRLEQEAAAIRQRMEIVGQNIALTPEHAQEVAAVNRDYDAISGDYHQLLEKQMTAELRQNIEKRQQDERLRLLNPVALPKAPKSPNRFAIGVLGIAFSLAAALALPFALFFTDTSFKDSEEVGLEYGILVAAAIPVVDQDREQRRSTFQALILTSASVLLIVGSAFAYAQWFRS
jgi:polysaccharide biosynthesis transport protein